MAQTPRKHKVLIASMSLDLGGAETHIVELCLKLQSRGLEVVAVSSGGIFVERLQRAGIRHIEAPLHSRSPSSMLQARKILAEILRKEQPDIVHAHARIPAFLLSSLCKKQGIALVTTVHGSYAVSLPLRLLTRWGCKCLAVSDDICSYLMENYDIPRRDIFVTVNGIDTGLFSPDPAQGEALRRELSIAPEEKVLLSVSRLDPDADGGVARLMEQAPLLRQAIDRLRIVIVGGGEHFEHFRELAERLNRQAGEPYILLTGPRSDIARFCNACDVFFGVSRAALEAASCARPVVLAGTAGYLGPLDESTLAAARETNLTCRGHDWPQQPCLAQDVTHLLEKGDGSFGREMVLREYSAERMADDALRCYRAALLCQKSARYDFLLSGYYGYGNAGDELLLSTIVENLLGRMPEASICVLNHSTTSASCRQEVALARRFSLPQVLGALRRSEVLIFGGGSLLQDVTSSKSLFYYLALLHTARLCGCKTMLYGNGIGPLRTAFSRRVTARVLRHVDVITLRDPDSMRLLHELGIPDERVTLTADEVFTALHQPLPRLDCLPQRPYLAVSLRSWPKNDARFEAKLADILDKTADKYRLDVLFVPFQKKSDTAICRDVSRRMKHPSGIFEGDSAQVLSAVTNARAVVGMRLHALIFATAAGVPSIGIVYDQKVSAFYEMLEERHTVDCEQLDEALLEGHLDAILQDDGAARRTVQAAAALKQSALQNAAAAQALLEGEV